MEVQALGRNAAILLFGIFGPIVLLFQAYTGLSSARSDLRVLSSQQSVAKALGEAKPHLGDANDYALFSMMHAERTNLAVVTNKQNLKLAVMQIGFAVISLGLMFVILGINDGGGEGEGEAGGVKFNFKTGSTGAVVFVIGAAMATAGGVMRNEYKTVEVPKFQSVVLGPAPGGQASPSAVSPSPSEKAVVQETMAKCGRNFPADVARRNECFFGLMEKAVGHEE
jgi:hypothetical protein